MTQALAATLPTTHGQLSWRDTLLGVDTLFGLVELEGWIDLPDMRNGNSALDGRHGARPGRVLADQRIVTMTFSLAGDEQEFRYAVAELQRITAPSEEPAEEPLVVTWDGITSQVMARCVRRSIPTPVSYHYGLTEGAIQWAASDPRKLRVPSEQRFTGLSQPSGEGLIFPLGQTLDFGQPASGGSLYISNDGGAHAWPTFVIRGPVAEPQIVNATTGDRLAFAADYSVPDDQSIEIDTQLRTVRVSGTSVSRNAELSTRQWFSIPPGSTHEIQFRGGQYEPDALLTASWNHTDL
ncbi:Phage tail protein [Actinopolyspora xinjiangensis]|uniref:Phage tail protein n=1 Tax=Actinopolyspora xinjiangensis TaxID=405564 RepID=A0A1H0U352_9ACTN|nr:phage tail domain-containing protein [Actinopolyspora xinjiangensis]SDP60623.1 Phage tail protein [Actinopolyspora xinjiangensis]